MFPAPFPFALDVVRAASRHRPRTERAGVVSGRAASQPGLRVCHHCAWAGPLWQSTDSTGQASVPRSVGTVTSLRRSAGLRPRFRRRPASTGLAPDPAQPVPEPEDFEVPSGSLWPAGHRFADRTRAKHASVHELLAAGLRRRAIGHRLHITSLTVKLYAYGAAPEEPLPRPVPGAAVQARRVQALL